MDKELDDLLDSALDDYSKKTVKKSVETDSKINSQNSVTIEKTNLYVDDVEYEDRPVRSTASATSTSFLNKTNQKQQAGNKAEDEMKFFDEIFNDEQTKATMKQFTDAFSMFQSAGDEKQLLENFQKVMSELNIEDSDDDNECEEKANSDDLKNLSQGMEFFKNLQKSTELHVNIEKSEDGTQTPLNKVLSDINKNSEKVFKNLKTDTTGFPFGGGEFLSNLMSGSEGLDGEDPASSMMMEPILSMLFSKDILYPSLKMMLENYDKYMEERKDKLDEAEKKKLVDQRECIKEMCQVYESSKETDSKEKKSEQLKNILDLLDKCGMPPTELVPEINPFESLGSSIKPDSCPIS